MNFFQKIFGCKCGRCDECVSKKEETKNNVSRQAEPVAPTSEPFETPVENKQ